ncbi:hypothetical protein Hanom_Chr16g01421261 [Helianthus anomalus]
MIYFLFWFQKLPRLSTSAHHDLPYKRKKTRSGCRAFKTSMVTKVGFLFFLFFFFAYLLTLIEVLTIYCPNNLVGITQITQVFQDTDIG